MTLLPSSVDVFIIGAGLAGLSTKYHLKKSTSLLIEREPYVGGTARSFSVQSFTFDFTGHLLHLHFPYTKKLIRKLLKSNYYRCERKAFIYSHGKLTPYPFQANTFGLPEEVVTDCVLGVLERHINPATKINKSNFYLWSKQTFGDGITQEFMKPYNEKLYQINAQKMNAEWCGSFVPTPALEEVVRGALGAQNKDFGYNTSFLYPKNGGIQVLAEALAKGQKNVHLKTELKSVHWKKKEVLLSNGNRIKYRQLVNSIPLKKFLTYLHPKTALIKSSIKKLNSAGVLCLNLGIRRARISDASWVYFPEKDFLFYRIGFPMNFTPHAVPAGCSSLYVEIPLSKVKHLSQKKILAKCLSDLRKAKVLRKTDRIAVSQFLPIPHAYVIYDKDRAPVLHLISKFLKNQKIQSIGRYGAWKYSFMEEAIMDGKKAAEIIEGSKID